MRESDAQPEPTTAPPPPLPRRHRPLAIVSTAVGLVLLGMIAGRSGVSAAEREVFQAVNGLGPAWWYVVFPAMQTGTLLSGPTAAVVAQALRRRLLAAELLVAGVTGWLVARGLKLVVNRPRPASLLDGVVVRGEALEGLGYPSGHVTVAAALAVVLAAWLPRRWE